MALVSISLVYFTSSNATEFILPWHGFRGIESERITDPSLKKDRSPARSDSKFMKTSTFSLALLPRQQSIPDEETGDFVRYYSITRLAILPRFLPCFHITICTTSVSHKKNSKGGNVCWRWSIIITQTPTLCFHIIKLMYPCVAETADRNLPRGGNILAGGSIIQHNKQWRL